MVTETGSKCGTGVELFITLVTSACLRSPTSGMEVNAAVSGTEEWWTGQAQWSSDKRCTANVCMVGGSTLNLVILAQKQLKPANILVIYSLLLLPD